ncbi:MAG: hemerythrin domain-containing protein [Pseudomonadota bacterium]
MPNSTERSPKPRKRQDDDPFADLIAEHRLVRKLYRQYRRLLDAGEAGRTAADRESLARQLCAAIAAHADLEERVLYPALRAAGLDSHLMDEADVEHATARDLIARIEATAPGDDKFDARVIVLCEYVEHHVKEEEGEMFPQARQTKELDSAALKSRLDQGRARAEARRSGADAHPRSQAHRGPATAAR